MIRFLLGKSGVRWQFELHAIPVKRAEPDANGGLYESWMAEVGAFETSDCATGDSSGGYGGGWDAGRAW